MANRICEPLFEVQDYQKARVKIPAGETFYPGQVVMCETIDTGITDNLEVYAATPVADITSEIPCILINQKWEQLPDGRRPGGNPDTSTYDWADEDVLFAIRLQKNMKFRISDDAIDGTGVLATAAGVYLIPQNNDYELVTAASVGTSVTALKVEVKTTQPIGGLNGNSFVDVSYVRVTDGY